MDNYFFKKVLSKSKKKALELIATLKSSVPSKKNVEGFVLIMSVCDICIRIISDYQILEKIRDFFVEIFLK